MAENGQKCSISMISHINLGGAGQQPAKHGQQGGTRDLFGPSERHALLLGNSFGLLFSSRTLHLFLLNSAKTFCFFRLSFIPMKRVAPQVHLPAWNAINNSGMCTAAPAAPVRAQWPDKLSIWFRPFVEVHVGWPNWDPSVIDAVWDTGWSHLV